MEQLKFAQNPASESSRRIDFDSSDVVPGIMPNTFFLIVRGKMPCINMEVSLSPLIYIRCPEYWGIEVIGRLPTGICLEQIGNYEKTIVLTGITGSEGIEVMGATRTSKHNLPGGCSGATEFGKDGPFPMKSHK